MTDDPGFIRKVSRVQYFVAIHDTHLAGFGCTGSCRELTFPRDDKRSKPTIRGSRRIGPALEVQVTNHLERYGIEIKIDSVQKDGTQSWTVISRGANKVRNGASGRERETHSLRRSTGQLEAMKQRNNLHFPHRRQQSYRSINGSGTTFPSVGRIDGCSHNISKLMTRLLRHEGYPREDD